MLWL
jgi:hypothetical protein